MAMKIGTTKAARLIATPFCSGTAQRNTHVQTSLARLGLLNVSTVCRNKVTMNRQLGWLFLSLSLSLSLSRGSFGAARILLFLFTLLPAWRNCSPHFFLFSSGEVCSISWRSPSSRSRSFAVAHCCSWRKHPNSFVLLRGYRYRSRSIHGNLGIDVNFKRLVVRDRRMISIES